MNHSDKAENDLIHASRLDSIFYVDLINKKTTEINEIKDTTYWRQIHSLYTKHKSRAYYYRNIKMYEKSREDSLLAIKYNRQAASKKIKQITAEIEQNKYPKQLGDKYWLRAKNYDILERFTEAKLDYDKALEIKPDYYRYLLSLSRHYILSGDLAKALETADLTMNLESSESYLALVYEIKGEIYLKEQNKETACEMYQKLVDLGHWSDNLRFVCQ